jgi:hypothetical protein
MDGARARLGGRSAAAEVEVSGADSGVWTVKKAGYTGQSAGFGEGGSGDQSRCRVSRKLGVGWQWRDLLAAVAVEPVPGRDLVGSLCRMTGP